MTTYAFDTENNLTDIYDAAQNHTHFDYISDHNVQKITHPSGYFEQFSWDGNDNLTYKWDRKNQEIVFHIDSQNRVGFRLDPGNTVYYTYDPAGRMTNVNDDTGTYTFSYDNMNRLSQATTDYTFDSAGAFTVRYGYDAASNRTSMTDPQSLSTAYGYDTSTALPAWPSTARVRASFGYDSLSRRTSLTRPNGVNTTYGYDPVSRLLSILHKLGSTTIWTGPATPTTTRSNRTSKTDLTSVNMTLELRLRQHLSAPQVTQGSSTNESYTYDTWAID